MTHCTFILVTFEICVYSQWTEAKLCMSLVSALDTQASLCFILRGLYMGSASSVETDDRSTASTAPGKAKRCQWLSEHEDRTAPLTLGISAAGALVSWAPKSFSKIQDLYFWMPVPLNSLMTQLKVEPWDKVHCKGLCCSVLLSVVQLLVTEHCSCSLIAVQWWMGCL